MNFYCRYSMWSFSVSSVLLCLWNIFPIIAMMVKNIYFLLEFPSLNLFFICVCGVWLSKKFMRYLLFFFQDSFEYKYRLQFIVVQCDRLTVGNVESYNHILLKTNGTCLICWSLLSTLLVLLHDSLLSNKPLLSQSKLFDFEISDHSPKEFLCALTCFYGMYVYYTYSLPMNNLDRNYWWSSTRYIDISFIIAIFHRTVSRWKI